jgi:hypothetical protein
LLESVKGTEIQWHPKKNLCEKTVKQKAGKPRGRNAQPQRVTVKTKKVCAYRVKQLCTSICLLWKCYNVSSFMVMGVQAFCVYMADAVLVTVVV